MIKIILEMKENVYTSDLILIQNVLERIDHMIDNIKITEEVKNE